MRRPGHAATALATWIGSFALWLFLVDRTAVAELLAGAVAAVIVTAVSTVLRRRDRLPLGLLARRFATARDVPARVVLDVGMVVSAVVGQLVRGQPTRGAFHEIPFAAAGGGGVGARAERYALVVAGSLAPGAYVAGFDRARGTVIVHTLDRRAATRIARLVRSR